MEVNKQLVRNLKSIWKNNSVDKNDRGVQIPEIKASLVYRVIPGQPGLHRETLPQTALPH